MTKTANDVLTGHVDPASALVVDDYPYGFRLRTQIRYWIESKPKFGDRFVSQTLNPKTGRWNKPKPGQYATVLFMFLDENGHVKTTGLGKYDQKVDRIEQFLADLGDLLNGVQKSEVTALLGAARVMANVEWTIRKAGTPEEEAAADLEQVKQQALIGRAIGMETAAVRAELGA